MKVVHKFPLDDLAPGIYPLKMPMDAQILDIQMQGKSIVLWATVETDNRFTTRLIECVMTGEQMDETARRRKHIKTLQYSAQMALVLHFFDLGERV